jgi:hypothetical protein
MRTDNPIADACIYYGQKEVLTYDYKCIVCESGFDSKFGVEYESDHFCNDCHEAGKHLAFYKSIGLDREEINQLTFKRL